MKRKLYAALSLLLCLLMLCLPALAGTQMLSDDHALLQQEALEAGHLVRQEYTLRLINLSDEEAPSLELAGQALEGVRLRRDRFDDIDATYESWTLFVQDTPVMTLESKRAGGEIRIRTSVLPGKVLVMQDGSEDPLAGPVMTFSMMQLFNIYLPNLPGGVLSLTEDEAAYVGNALAFYLYEIGAWVSKTQQETGNLYEYILDGIPASDARDEVAVGLEVNLSATDLKALLRRVADAFYEDEAMYPIVAHYLEAFGVTEQEVYDFSRWLPEGPLSNVEGITPTDASLFLGQYTNADDELVGLELSLPQLFEEIPLELEVDYAARREEEGLQGSGYLSVDVRDVVALAGEFEVSLGDVVDDTQRQLYSLALTGQEENPETLDAYLLREARYLDQDTLQSEFRLNVQDSAKFLRIDMDLYGTRETRRGQDARIEGADTYTLSIAQTGLTPSGDLAGSLAFEAVLEVITTTGEYTVPDFTGQEVVVADLGEAAMSTLINETRTGVTQAALQALSLMPEEVLNALGGMIDRTEANP